MNRAQKVGAGVAATLGVAVAAATFALFHGYFDHGLFQVKQADWSSTGKVAILAERSDHQALSGDVYFVLIGDHIFSPAELRSDYYGGHGIFAAASDCLNVHWTDPHNLTVSCRGESLDASRIENVQQHQIGDVAITYANIPDINRPGN